MRVDRQLAVDLDLKGVLATLQRICRDHQAPIVEVDGSQMLPTMPRKAPPQVGRQDKAYVGGEQFRPSEIIVEEDLLKDQLLISIVLVPVQARLVVSVSNVRLPLDQATQKFTGLERWITSVRPDFKQPDPVGVPAGPVVSLEEKRASEEWGAW